MQPIRVDPGVDADLMDGEFVRSWTQVFGPAAPPFEKESSALEAYLPEPGTYVYKLTEDRMEGRASDLVFVTWVKAQEDLPGTEIEARTLRTGVMEVSQKTSTTATDPAATRYSITEGSGSLIESLGPNRVLVRHATSKKLRVEAQIQRGSTIERRILNLDGDDTGTLSMMGPTLILASLTTPHEDNGSHRIDSRALSLDDRSPIRVGR